jgi:hypothetical protein
MDLLILLVVMDDSWGIRTNSRGVHTPQIQYIGGLVKVKIKDKRFQGGGDVEMQLRVTRTFMDMLRTKDKRFQGGGDVVIQLMVTRTFMYTMNTRDKKSLENGGDGVIQLPKKLRVLN